MMRNLLRLKQTTAEEEEKKVVYIL